MTSRAVTVLAVLLFASGCSLLPGGDEEASSPTPATSAPTRPAAPKDAVEATADGQDDLTASVVSFVADGQGLGRLTYTLKNVGGEEYQISGPFAGDDSFRTLSVQPSNVQVLDDQTREIQYTLADSERNCLCYWTPPGADYFSLEPDDEATFANMFPISDEARTVTVMLPGFQPVKNVEVKRPS